MFQTICYRIHIFLHTHMFMYYRNATVRLLCPTMLKDILKDKAYCRGNHETLWSQE